MKCGSIIFFLSNFGFLIGFAQPTITSFSPASGPIGTSVTISGTNFNTTPANNMVFFGAVKATVNTAASTSLTVIVPVGATYQYISITDITTGLTAFSAQPFITSFTCGGVMNANSFAPKLDYAMEAGAGPFNVAIGDLDGDGKSDIAVANVNSNTVSVFRNMSTNGTISFPTKVDFIMGGGSYSVAIGDLDGDGKPDLAVANYTLSTVSVFRNTSISGTISFDTKVDFTTAAGPFKVAIGDLEGDGKPDLAVANWSSNTVSVLKNTSISGTISFAAKVDYTAGDGPRSIAIGDLDGNGMPDLAVTNLWDHTVSVFGNTSMSGTISFAAKLDYTTGPSAESVVIGDLDGDGKSDLATAKAGNTVSVFRNTSISGAISFTPYVDYLAGTDHRSIAIGDLDGDGKPDLAAANSSSNLLVLKNTSVSGTVSFFADAGYSTGTDPRSVAIGDLDGDGKADLAVANFNSNTVSVFRNQLSAIAAMTSSNTATICSGSTVNIPLTSDVPATYSWLATDNLNTTGESITNQLTGNLNDAITNNTNTTQTLTYTVTPTATTSACAGAPQTVMVTVNPLPIVSFSGLDSILCYNASTQTLVGSPAGGSFSGSGGLNGTAFNPSIAGSGTHTITYSYIDTNTCINTESHNTEVLPLPITPAICMVTTDSMSTNNIVYWDKTPYTNVDSFIVYRETTLNTYNAIGAVSMDSLSMFIDTVRQLYFPFTGDPNSGTYRYKLQIRDTCGNYSPLSPYHNSIYVNRVGGYFTWNAYQIEGEPTPIPELTSYYLYRDNNSSNDWTLVSGVAGSQLTINDPNYSTYPNARWRVETQWNIACSPTRSSVNSSRSNTTDHTVGIRELNDPAPSFNVYPNPFSGNTTIKYRLNKKSDVSIEVYNAIGQKVETLVTAAQAEGEYKYSFDTQQKENIAGIYFVKFIIDGNIMLKRLVKLD